MKLLPWNSEKRVPMTTIIVSILTGIFTFFVLWVSTGQADKPKDIPIEMLKELTNER